jgi:outer membrane protein assembly factor BamB
MFHHDENQIGFSTSSAPDTDDVLWSYQTGNYITSSPAVMDGKVYIGSWDKKLYCFDMMTGDVLWNFTTGGKITSSPAIDNGK